MTRPLCDFCFLPTEAVRRIRHKRCGLVWVCATRKHVGCTARLTREQRGMQTRRMVEMAGGG